MVPKNDDTDNGKDHGNQVENSSQVQLEGKAAGDNLYQLISILWNRIFIIDHRRTP